MSQSATPPAIIPAYPDYNATLLLPGIVNASRTAHVSNGPGQSQLPPPGAPYTLEMMVRDAVGLLDQLGIQRVHWAAKASGGHLGLALAHPHRGAPLTLCSTALQ